MLSQNSLFYCFHRYLRLPTPLSWFAIVIMPGTGKRVTGKQGKYSDCRNCLACKRSHEGGVNERCQRAAPHEIANYCSSNNIPYPADLLKGKRLSRGKRADANLPKGKRSQSKPPGPSASSTDNSQQDAPPDRDACNTRDETPGDGQGVRDDIGNKSFDDLCLGVSEALGPTIAKSIAEALKTKQPRQNQSKKTSTQGDKPRLNG